MGRYTQIGITRTRKATGIAGRSHYVGNKYPEVGLSPSDTYVYASQGDRFDTLALQYYGDSSLWWIISIANETLNQSTYFLPLDIQIRIPANYSAIVSSYNALNNI
jgi:phage tail protein X